MREEYKIQASELRRDGDGIIGQGRYVCQNTQLATGISVIHRLVQNIMKPSQFYQKSWRKRKKKMHFFRGGGS